MHETRNHGFHEIQELMPRHLTALTSDENSLTGGSHIKQQRAEKNKAHVDTCEITEKYQHQVITNQKTFSITIYSFCSAHLA